MKVLKNIVLLNLMINMKLTAHLSNDERLKSLYRTIEDELKKHSLGSHDLEHHQRVTEYAIKVGENEGTEMNVLIPSALLHDIARPIADESSHSKVSAEMSQKILQKHGYSKKEIERITECIKSHDFSSNNDPESLEAKVLYDADKLDALGEKWRVGVARWFLFSGERGLSLKEAIAGAYRVIEVCIRKNKKIFFTRTGRELGFKDFEDLDAFFEKLTNDLK